MSMYMYFEALKVYLGIFMIPPQTSSILKIYGIQCYIILPITEKRQER